MGYHDIFKGTNYFIGILVLSIVSTICNILLLLIVIRTKNLRTVPNIYISSIATANLLSGIFTGISVSINTLGLSENDFWCSVFPVTDRFLVAAGVFSMVALCIDRYRFYVREASNHDVKPPTKVLPLIWLLSFVYGFCTLVITLTITKNATSLKNNSCSFYEEFPYFNAQLRLTDLAVIFATSAITIVVVFCMILKKLRNQQVINSFVFLDSHKRSVYLLLSVTMMEWFACVPFYIYEIVHGLTDSFSGIDLTEETEDIIKLCTVLLTVCSYTTMPLIYFVFSAQIKNEMNKMMCKNNRVKPEISYGHKDSGCNRWADKVDIKLDFVDD